MDDISVLIANAERDLLLGSLQQRKGFPTVENMKEFKNFDHFLQEIDMSEKGVANFARELYEKYKENIFIYGTNFESRFFLQLRMDGINAYYYYLSYDGNVCGALSTGLANSKDESDLENRQYWRLYRFGLDESAMVAEAKRLADIVSPSSADMISWMRYLVMRNVYEPKDLEQMHDWYREFRRFPKMYHEDFMDWQRARKADLLCLKQAKLWSFSAVERRQISWKVVWAEFGKDFKHMGVYRANAASNGFYLDKGKGKIICNYCAAEMEKETKDPSYFHTDSCPYIRTLRPRLKLASGLVHGSAKFSEEKKF
jgi:hypothetical protein